MKDFLIHVPIHGEMGDRPLGRRARRQEMMETAAPGCVTMWLAKTPVCASHADSHYCVHGPLFERYGPGSAVAAIDNSTREALLRGDWSLLLEKYWGHYIALLKTGDGISILRDPSGARPCYYWTTEEEVTLSSNLTILSWACGRNFGIDWARLGAGLFHDELPSTQTALCNVCELGPGEALTIRGGVKTHLAWSPWDHVSQRNATAGKEQSDHLRRTVENVISALSRYYGPSALGISRGLDSSIVLACLARDTPVCFTLSTHDARGDERYHAQCIASYFGITLEEHSYKIEDIDLHHAASAQLPRPTGRIIGQAYDARVRKTIEQHGCRAFMTGNGGDNVFAYSQSAAPVADRLLHQGLTIPLAKTVKDICTLTGCSLMTAIGHGLRLATRRVHYRWPVDGRFLRKDRQWFAELGLPDHPWLNPPDGALPGKAAHIAGLLRIQPYLAETGRLGDIPILNPLMTQPVMEACLAIPSWDWCAGGVDRSVARQAFAHSLPREINARKSKGSPDGFASQILESNLDCIRERLLDGLMACKGVTDRPALEQILLPTSDRSQHQSRLLQLLEAESWAEHWHNRDQHHQ